MVFGSGLAAAGLRVSIDAVRTVTELCDRGEVDLIVGRLSRTSAAAGLLADWRVPFIMDADDWEPSRTAARIKSTSRHKLLTHAYLQRELRGNLYLGKQVLENADHIWLASENDVAILDRRHVTTLPNLPITATGEEISALKPSAAKSKVVFSVGDWGKKQNTDGMNWYLRQVWPSIRQRIPQAELRIAGATRLSLAREWSAMENVRIRGFVDVLRSEYEEAAVVATPITWGGGTKIKVLEALAYGRVPTGPSHAFEGLPDPRTLEKIAAVADDPAILSEATVAMLVDAPMRNALEIAAANYYVDNHSIAAFNKHVKDTVEAVMSAPKHKRGGSRLP